MTPSQVAQWIDVLTGDDVERSLRALQHLGDHPETLDKLQRANDRKFFTRIYNRLLVNEDTRDSK